MNQKIFKNNLLNKKKITKAWKLKKVIPYKVQLKKRQN